MKLIIILTFCLISLFKLMNATNFCRSYGPQCECPRSDTIICENFTRLNELTFKQVETNLTQIKYLFIQPIRSIPFDYNFDLRLLRFSNYVDIALSNFNRFNIFANPFRLFRSMINSRFNLNLNNSIIDFTLNDDTILNEATCNSLMINETMFTSFDRVTFHSFNKYPNKQCTKIFTNATISSIILFNQEPSNQLAFLTSSSPNEFYTIGSVYVYHSLINIDSGLFNKNLFKLVNSIYFFNTAVYRYEKNLFREFKYLKSLIFDLVNFRQFINENLYSISSDINIDVNEPNIYHNLTYYDIQTLKSKQFEILLQDSKMEFEFNDNDFCLFKNWPHQRLVYPAISSRPSLKCSCTLMWLIQYYQFYHEKYRLITNSTYDCQIPNNTFYYQLIQNCNFNQKIYNCENRDTNQTSNKKYTLSELELGLIIGLPIAFFLILITFILILYACRQKKFNSDNGRIYKF